MDQLINNTPHKSRFLSKIKDIIRVNRLYFMNLLSSLYERFFVKSEQECPYFSKGMESFAIMLKGKSLELFPKYDQEFENCFLVNNYDEEVELIGNSLLGKKCVQFVNRLETAFMHPKNYQKFNITDIQMNKLSAFGDQMGKRCLKYYKSLGLKTHFLPKQLLQFNKDFGKEYAKKYPNTGILAIIYSLETLRPKTLWIIGLDFYQSDYLVRRPHQNPLDVQQAKMRRINLIEVTANIFRKYPKVKINMISYYQGFPELPNVKILR